MKTVAAVVMLALLTGCASSMQDRRMNDVGENPGWATNDAPSYSPGLLALGAALLQASGPRTLAQQPPNDYAWAWDLQRAPNGLVMWVCRGIQSGQYSDQAHCAYQPQIDSHWPGF